MYYENQANKCKPAELKCDLRGAFLEDYCTEKGEVISTAPKTISTLSRYKATISLTPTWLLIQHHTTELPALFNNFLPEELPQHAGRK